MEQNIVPLLESRSKLQSVQEIYESLKGKIGYNHGNALVSAENESHSNLGLLNAVFASILSLSSPTVFSAPTLTCLNDSFTGANNSAPDTTNWSVQKINGTFTPSISGNRLRLTDTSSNSSTRVTNKNLFPFGNNIVIAEFDYWSYGGSGADGIAVIFSDPDKPTTGGNNPPTAGGFGGSLGYANRCSVSGFSYGWLGIGIDEFGNYSNPTECRNGGTGAAVNAISLRGSGNGATSPSTSNYPYITGTGSLGNNGVAKGNSSVAYRYRITLDSLTDTSKIMVKVERDKNTGVGYQTLINYDLKPKITTGTQAPLPPRLQFTYTGSTGGSTNNHEVDNLQICAADIVSATVPHHIEIQGDSTSGVTCMSTILTVKACANAACSTLHTGGVVGTLTASGAPTVNWSGGNTFSIPAGSSSTTKTVQVTTPGSVIFGATGGTNATTCSVGALNSCSFTTADSGFVIDAPDHVSETIQTLSIKAVKKGTNTLSCVPGMTGTKVVNVSQTYVNPPTGTLPVRMGGIPLTTAGANLSLTFDATGTANYQIQYADVGNVRVNASYSGTTGTEAGLSMIGNGSFITAPQSFVFTAIPNTGLNKAGAPFSTTIAAVNAGGFATPNFGKESTPEGVQLSSVLVTPATGANPNIRNGTITGTSFVNGYATSNTPAWDEVGNIKLKADLSNGTYLGTTPTTGTSNTLARFIPDHFDTLVSPTMTCAGMVCPSAGMVYSGQPFTTNVTAKSAANTTTLNYDSALGFSKPVTVSAAVSPGGILSSAGNISNGLFPASSFGAGSSSYITSPKPSFNFTTTPTLPTDIYVRATDSDGASSVRSPAASSQESGTKVVSGKLKVTNAYGSELLDLPVPLETQYYSPSGFWTKNISDSTTVINTATDLVQTIIKGPLTSVTPLGAGPLTFIMGSRIMTLLKPGVPGSANLNFSAPSYLPANTSSVTFGIYKGSKNIIYMRESY